MKVLARGLVAVLSVLMLGIVAAGVGFLAVQKRHLRTELESRLLAIAQLKVSQIVQWRAGRLAEATVQAESPFMSSAVERWMASPTPEVTESLRSRLASFQRHYQYREALLTDVEGGIRLSCPPDGGRLHPEMAAALATAVKERRTVITDLHAEPSDPQPHIGVVAPFFVRHGATDTPVGALVLVNEARQFLYPMIGAWPTESPSAETMLIRRDGDSVLYLNDLRHQSNTALRLRLPLSRTDLPVVQAVLGRTGIFHGRDYRGVATMSALQPIPDSPWCLVAKIDEAEVDRVWFGHSVIIAATMMLVSLLGIAAVAALWVRNERDHFRNLFESEAARRKAALRYQASERTANAALAEGAARFRSLFDHMAEGAALHKMVRDGFGRAVNYRVADVNEAYLEIFGRNREEVAGRLATEIEGTAAAPHLAEFDGVAATRKPLRFGTRHEATGRDLEISVAPWGDDGFATIVTDVTARVRSERQLQESEQRFRGTLDRMMEGCQIIDTDWRYLYVNEEAARHGRRTPADLLGRTMMEAYPGIERTPLFERLQRCMESQTPDQFDNEFTYPGGSRGWFQLRVQPVPEGLFILSIDLTSRKAAEEEQTRLQNQLLQAKKMESVGRLAGGIAHDFNNMLQAIMGNADLALEITGPTGPLAECLQEIVKAGEHSAEMTRQLLGFARKQTIVPQVLNLNDTIGDMVSMLRRLIGEDIELVWTSSSGAATVRMDPFQIRQIVVNLATNARDAIGGVGRIAVATAGVTLDEAFVRTRPDAAAGDYVLMSVSDTGTGLSPEAMDHLFEPFFTSKEVGRGTGLGLATIYGIVRQNNGFIEVESQPGRGTTFRVYLPRCAEPAREEVALPEPELRGGQETILLVEDEPYILDLGHRILSGLGYTVLKAASPDEALKLAGEHDGTIHLLVTDVVMPGMNGCDLARELTTRRPDLRSLFMSGYTSNVIARHGPCDSDLRFLQKPFTIEALAAAVRGALDGR